MSTDRSIPIFEHSGNFVNVEIEDSKNPKFPAKVLKYAVEHNGNHVGEYVKLPECEMSGIKSKDWENGNIEYSVSIYLSPLVPEQKACIEKLNELHDLRVEMAFAHAVALGKSKKWKTIDDARRDFKPTCFLPDKSGPNGSYIVKCGMYSPSSPNFSYPKGIETLANGEERVITKRIHHSKLMESKGKSIRIKGIPIIRWRDLYASGKDCKERFEIFSCAVSSFVNSASTFNQADDAKKILAKNSKIADEVESNLGSTDDESVEFPEGEKSISDTEQEDEENEEQEEEEDVSKFMKPGRSSKASTSRSR